MVPLVAPCHAVAASVWDCDNCIPVVELLGCAANRELPAGSSSSSLRLVDNQSMLRSRQHTLTYVQSRTCSSNGIFWICEWAKARHSLTTRVMSSLLIWDRVALSSGTNRSGRSWQGPDGGGDRWGRFADVINGALPSQTTLSRASHPPQERGRIWTVFRQQTAGKHGEQSMPQFYL